MCERYGDGGGVINDSDDAVEGGELLRERILWMEDVEIKTVKNLDTCQKLKLEEVA